MFKRKPKVLTPQEMEEIRTKDFFDCILPGTIKFLSDHYILGDNYCCVWVIREYPPSTEEQAILSQLAGEKVLVLGNHDRHRTPAQWRSLGFAEAVPWPLVWEGFFLLSHEPLYVNRNMPYANVFGHVHGNPAYRDVSSRSVCVSVERTGFAPLSARELRERLQNEQSV